MATKVHVSLDVKDMEASVRFYSVLFNMEPTKLKPGYAKFDVADPAINLTLGKSSAATVTGPNHMGIRVNLLDEVINAKDRLEEAGFTTSDEMGTTCCYAVQDKIWTADPSGNRWEVYIFKGDAESFGTPPLQNEACSPGGACCSDVGAEDKRQPTTQAATAGACCAADARSAEEQKQPCCAAKAS
ncbi:MAG TPA: ArsI/CadI family heavy metal resistance metalloenzyme [Terriglobales bacterium]|nr:ArsI/CadI family heavy metal resistance metalloenzyme [Terriglobales bacterium]